MRNEQPTLFDPETLVGRFALWHRRNRRCRWRLVGTADTEIQTAHMMRGSGEFITMEGGRHPNDDRGARKQPGAKDEATEG